MSTTPLLRSLLVSSILLTGCSKPSADLAACRVEAMKAHIQADAFAPFDVACMKAKGYSFGTTDDCRAGYNGGLAVEWCFEKEGLLHFIKSMWAEARQ